MKADVDVWDNILPNHNLYFTANVNSGWNNSRAEIY